MAFFNVKERSELGIDLVLAPERFDPRREGLSGLSGAVSLGTVARSQRKIVNPRSNGSGMERVIVLDTSDAREGILVGRKEVVSGAEIGSTKKLVPIGSVIVSRLRPYLRQVAFVDRGLEGWQDGVGVVCSTEFFVLTPRDDKSIAFLAPFLLSDSVQSVLAASQEGGHHPRFDEETLVSLPVPNSWLVERESLSSRMEEAIRSYRSASTGIAELVDMANGTLQKPPKKKGPREG